MYFRMYPTFSSLKTRPLSYEIRTNREASFVKSVTLLLGWYLAIVCHGADD